MVKRPVNRGAWGTEKKTEGGGTAYLAKGMGDPETEEILDRDLGCQSANAGAGQ